MEIGRITMPSWRHISMAGGILLLAMTIILHAWISEDAYITFRVLDNFINGYGLRWNIGERVQAYTHPLWMLLHIPFYALWHNLFLVSIALSIACSFAALGLTLTTVRRSPLITACCFLAPLALSRSFLDYTSSGLENPLSYALFALFGWIVIHKHNHTYFWFICALTVSLALLNRLDSIMLYAPPVLYLMYIQRADLRWRQIMTGMLPLIAWFYFSLFYYGFFFPNTKYAKLDTGLDLALYLTQGLHYAKYLLIWDMPGALILFSLLLFIVMPKRFYANAPLSLPYLSAAIALGIICYCTYVITIGGDYMAGRFWAVPIFATVWLWYVFCPHPLRPDIGFASVALFLTAYTLSPLFEEIRASCKECIELHGKVIDAHRIFRRNALIADLPSFTLRPQGQYHFAKEGRKLAKENPPPITTMRYIGMVGFYAGPNVVIIDELGLADPLLSRLPAVPTQNFYVGHFRRALPRGYKLFLETGSLTEMSPPLAYYYEKLHLITAGDLLDRERLKTILLFNLGMYDRWKDEYVNAAIPP